MSEKEKLVKAEKALKYYVVIGSFYLLLGILLLIDVFFLNGDESVQIFSTVSIFAYTIVLLSFAFVTINLLRLKNPMSIRKKAIKDSDERSLQIRNTANSVSFVVVMLILLFGIVLSVQLNSVELFSFSLVLLFFSVIIQTITRIVLHKRQ